MRKLKKAYVEITNVCNGNCSFCHGTKRGARYMSETEFERVLGELKGVTEYVYLHVLGEPLCHPRVLDFIRQASSEGYKVTVTTNGKLLSRELLDSRVYKLQISLHSFEDEEGRREYIDSVLDTADIAAQKGILVSLRLWNLDSGVSNSYTESLLEKRFPKPWREGRDCSYTLRQNLFLSYAHRFEWPDMTAEDNGEGLFCYGLRDQIGILCDGTVVPCCLDAEGDMALGNIYTERLEDIISSPRAAAIYDGFSERRAVEALCRRCKYAKRFERV